MKRFSLLALLSASMIGPGCGPNCQDTCNAIYQPVGSGGCDITRPGRQTQELVSSCRERCETALEKPGPLGNYDPFNDQKSADEVNLETDRQAAEWMDCVAETSCNLLDKGFCAPIW